MHRGGWAFRPHGGRHEAWVGGGLLCLSRTAQTGTGFAKHLADRRRCNASNLVRKGEIRMKLRTATSVLFRYAIQDAVKVVAQCGYDGIDLWGGRPHVYRQDLSPAELKELRQSIADHGLSVASLMPAFYRYPHSLSNPNPKVRRDSIDYMRQCTDNAAILGSPIVLVVPDFSLFGQATEDSRKRMVDSVGEVATYAAQYDLKLGIEVLYEDETDLVVTSDDALYMIKALGNDNLGVVLDTGALH